MNGVRLNNTGGGDIFASLGEVDEIEDGRSCGIRQCGEGLGAAIGCDTGQADIGVGQHILILIISDDGKGL